MCSTQQLPSDRHHRRALGPVLHYPLQRYSTTRKRAPDRAHRRVSTKGNHIIQVYTKQRAHHMPDKTQAIWVARTLLVRCRPKGLTRNWKRPSIMGNKRHLLASNRRHGYLPVTIGQVHRGKTAGDPAATVNHLCGVMAFGGGLLCPGIGRVCISLNRAVTG